MKLKLTLTMMTLALLVVFTASIASAQSDALPAPTGTTVANGSELGQVVVSWDAVDDAAFYRIGWVALPDYQAAVSAEQDWLEAFHFLDAANTGQAQWTLTRLSPGVQYYFIVASNGVPQYSGWSQPLTLTSDSTTVQVDYSDQYPNCDAVRAHHPGGVKRGSPVYRPALDPDGDGTACELTASAPSGNYLPIQSIGTFTGTGDNSNNVFRLRAGIYRFTTSRQNTDGYVFVDIVELSNGSEKSVGIFGSGDSGGSKLVTIYSDDSSFRSQAGDYILEVDASDTTRDWTVTVELIMAH